MCQLSRRARSRRRQAPGLPALAGQFAPYLELQLALWREGKRPGGSATADIMETVAHRLEPGPAADVARYFAAIRPADAAAAQADGD